MPSRKRSKGKERKAKQTEANLSKDKKTWIEWVLWSQQNDKIRCNHGHDINLTSSHDCVHQFLESFLFSNEKDALLTLESLESTQPLVWKDDDTSYRKELINILTVMTANQLLFEAQFGITQHKSLLHWGLQVAVAILVLENYQGNIPSTSYLPYVAGMYSRLNPMGGKNINNRDLLKFISNRLSCSCLKDLNS